MASSGSQSVVCATRVSSTDEDKKGKKADEIQNVITVTGKFLQGLIVAASGGMYIK